MVVRPSRLLSAYRAATSFAEPLAARILRQRLARGKEDEDRLPERLGRPGRVRPKGPLVWIHAASVGESVSVLPLIRKLGELRPDTNVLVTTGTVTSGRVMGERLPANAFHQFVPVDTPSAVRAFLDYWQPGLALWVESELWPNMLHEIKERKIPAALINARMSDSSYRNWRRAKHAARELLGAFDLCLAQDESVAEKLIALGAPRVEVPGNLKLVGEPLPFDVEALAELRSTIGDRPMWLLASSHDGEEQLAAFAHRDLIYIADTMGELGVFYRLCQLTVMGGSFVPHGGQNPLEPARAKAAVISGPHIHNFRDIFRILVESGGVEVLTSNDQLTERLRSLLDNSDEIVQRGLAAEKVANTKEPLEQTFKLLKPYLSTLNGHASA
jgi:3-deoxy-D-manno-octulosonic-acid transferase